MATRKKPKLKAPGQRPKTPPTFEQPKDFQMRQLSNSKLNKLVFGKGVIEGGGPHPPGRKKSIRTAKPRSTKPNRPRSPTGVKGQRLPLEEKRSTKRRKENI